jgi:predicted nucleic acid-binding protein
MPPRKTPVYGIDTSVLVRLLTGHPAQDFEATSLALGKLFSEEPTVELVASNQVIGETYITLQHHYGLSKPDAREGIRDFLADGMVAPLNGVEVLEVLQTHRGAGLMDRLIAQDYAADGLPVLTNDRSMGKILGVRLL